MYLVDGMACKEARVFERRVASLLALQWERRYSKMVGFVRTGMSIVIVRSNTMLLRGDKYQWEADETGAGGLNCAKCDG